MTKRWFNYRPICLVFAFLLLGSIFSFYLDSYKIASTIIAFGVFVSLLTLAFKCKKLKYFLVPFVSFIVGVFAYNIAIFSFTKTINETPNTIEARIYSINKIDNGVMVVEAENCIFDSIKVGDNVTIRIYDNNSVFNNVEIGSIVCFTPKSFYKSDLFYYETPNSSMFSSDLKYTALVDVEDITFVGNNKTLAEVLKSKIKTNLAKGLTNENVEIAYSSLFGEKELLPEKQYESFRLSGVAHLLAVSGLHVGLLTVVLYKLLDLLRIKRWWRFLIVATFLTLYAYICNFAVSIIRASVMSLILLISDIVYREYDTFNSISIAGIILFLINPLTAFDVGFLMSFSCVFGIAILMQPIKEILHKIKFKNPVAESLAISISTTIALMFIMAYFFKTLNLISIIANIIIIPIFTVAFICVFIGAVLSLIIPVITILLYPINYLLSFITMLSSILGNLPFASFTTMQLPYISLVIYLALLLILGRLCVANNQEKLFASVPLVAILMCCLV